MLTEMQKSGSVSKSNNSLRVSVPQQSLRRMGLCSPGGGHAASPVVFPEKRNKVKTSASRQNINPTSVGLDDPFKVKKADEHRIDIIGGGGGDEKSDLLGYVVFAGKLVLDKRRNVDDKNGKDGKQNSSEISTQEGAVNAKLTSKALVWGSNVLPLDDVVSVCPFHSSKNKIRKLTLG